MPWLAIRFGYKLFFPLYPSIFLINFLGIFAYDFFKEDVFFLELGKNWIQEEGTRFTGLKNILKRSDKLIFVALSIWPSPIAGYIFLRDKNNESPMTMIKVIALGSIYCTAVWGGGLSLIRFAIVFIMDAINAKI